MQGSSVVHLPDVFLYGPLDVLEGQHCIFLTLYHHVLVSVEVSLHQGDGLLDGLQSYTCSGYLADRLSSPVHDLQQLGDKLLDVECILEPPDLVFVGEGERFLLDGGEEGVDLPGDHLQLDIQDAVGDGKHAEVDP